MAKNIDFLELNLDNKFDLKRKSADLICDTVQKLKYCDGVPDDNYEVAITIFRENVPSFSSLLDFRLFIC
jgi:hypothetical protein